VTLELTNSLTGGSANDIRLEVVGSTVNVYINNSGVPILNDVTAVTGGNGCGMITDQVLTRIKSITAY
jgi:hypothetical protein